MLNSVKNGLQNILNKRGGKMTKEELEKEADEYSKTVKCEWESETYWVDCYDEVTDAYIAGAEPREKRIAELEAQIEKMKCCSNCIHLANCDLSGYEECKNFDKWEFREIKEK